MPALLTIKNRRDFKAADRGRRATARGFVLLGRQRGPEDWAGPSDTVRFGLTVTKRIGNAVVRNRVRRRLRALASAHLPQLGHEGWDYVLIGRPLALTEPFEKLSAELESALKMLHKAGRRHRTSSASRP